MSSLLRLTVSTATPERVSSERSMVTSEPRCSLQHLQAGREVVEDGADRLVAGGERGGQPVDAVQRVGDVLLWSSRSVTSVSTWLSMSRTSRLVAAQRLVQLGGDGVELLDAAAVEQQRQRAEDLLDLGVAVGARHAG